MRMSEEKGAAGRGCADREWRILWVSVRRAGGTRTKETNRKVAGRCMLEARCLGQ